MVLTSLGTKLVVQFTHETVVLCVKYQPLDLTMRSAVVDDSIRK